MSLICKKCVATFWAIFGGKLGNFLVHHLVTVTGIKKLDPMVRELNKILSLSYLQLLYPIYFPLFLVFSYSNLPIEGPKLCSKCTTYYDKILMRNLWWLYLFDCSTIIVSAHLKSLILLFYVVQLDACCCGCGSVDRLVTSDSRGPRQKYYI